jgi:hypothetical protein
VRGQLYRSDRRGGGSRRSRRQVDAPGAKSHHRNVHLRHPLSLTSGASCVVARTRRETHPQGGSESPAADLWSRRRQPRISTANGRAAADTPAVARHTAATTRAAAGHAGPAEPGTALAVAAAVPVAGCTTAGNSIVPERADRVDCAEPTSRSSPAAAHGGSEPSGRAEPVTAVGSAAIQAAPAVDAASAEPGVDDELAGSGHARAVRAGVVWALRGTDDDASSAGADADATATASAGSTAGPSSGASSRKASPARRGRGQAQGRGQGQAQG